MALSTPALDGDAAGGSFVVLASLSPPVQVGPPELTWFVRFQQWAEAAYSCVVFLQLGWTLPAAGPAWYLLDAE